MRILPLVPVFCWTKLLTLIPVVVSGAEDDWVLVEKDFGTEDIEIGVEGFETAAGPLAIGAPHSPQNLKLGSSPDPHWVQNLVILSKLNKHNYILQISKTIQLETYQWYSKRWRFLLFDEG